MGKSAASQQMQTWRRVERPDISRPKCGPTGRFQAETGNEIDRATDQGKAKRAGDWPGFFAQSRFQNLS